jgi:anti-anti-sigma factor
LTPAIRGWSLGEHRTPSGVAVPGPARTEEPVASNGSLTIATDEHGGGWTLRLAGELDMATAPQLVGMLQTEKPVVIDLRGLTFLDSSGLSALLKISTSCACLRLIPGPTNVQRVFEVTGTERYFQWHDGHAEETTRA